MARTVRLRFTLLYAAVFLASAVGLLVLTNLLSQSKVTEPAPGQSMPTGSPDQRIAQLQAQLADVGAEQTTRLLTGSMTALVVMAAVSVLLGRALAGRVLRPLREITAATRRISAENLHERLAAPGPDDEVKELADTVDGLLARLEAAFDAQRRFVANAAHELRTPLATMRASLDVAVAKPEPLPAQTRALADRLRPELDRVDHLLEGFLALARAQHGALGEQAAVGLADLVADALAAHAGGIAARGLTVEADTADAAVVPGSAALLARLVANLIDNAVTHNQEGGWIRVATATGASALLVVETGGAVLDPEQVARLARPFRRLAADRTGSDCGSGLGLSIVAAIVEAHGGRLDLSARSEGGLRVIVSLPVAAAREPVTG
jgi:signal transduction histidine kinase